MLLQWKKHYNKAQIIKDLKTELENKLTNTVAKILFAADTPRQIILNMRYHIILLVNIHG